MALRRTTENYLKTIYLLSQRKEVRGAYIAEELGISRPTVSVTLKAMEKDGGMDKSRGYNLGYTGNNESLGDFQDFIRERLGTEYHKMVAVGSVIGVHVGPGASAIAVFLN